MSNISAITLSGDTILISSQQIESFLFKLKGQVIFSHSSGYDDARKVWNGMIDKKPALIVKCAGEDDVINTVKFAREYNLLVSVKCGGHNFGGLSVCDNGIMIDLANMNSIAVDPRSKIARAEGGALLADLDKTTQAFGLATTSGTVSHTGIAGLTLGGGQGWMMNKYGLTCDNLLSVRIVTADGKLLSANKDQNTDLFWAVRGGGGNFGIVTSFEYQLHEIGPTILGGLIIYPFTETKNVIRFFREFSMKTPDELTLLSGLLCLPDGSPAIAVAVGWLGDIEEGKKVIQPLRDFGTPVADLVSEIPYLQLQCIFDAAVAHGISRYVKMGYVEQLTDEFIDVLIDKFDKRVSPLAIVLLNTMKGAVSRVDAAETPFYHRQPQWHFDIITQWTEKKDEEQNLAWVRNFWNEAMPFTRGASINFLGGDDGQDRVKLSFGSNYDRLAAIKMKYDPDNFFRLNANIVPGSAKQTQNQSDELITA